jgi:hypothetical protein
MSTTPTYTVWSSGTLAQTNAETEVYFFRFDWVNVWATNADTARAIVLQLMEDEFAKR